MTIKDNGVTYEWEGALTIKTPITVTGSTGKPTTISFGQLCNFSAGHVWRVFAAHGYVV